MSKIINFPSSSSDVSQYIINVDESSSSITYVGWASPGVSNSDAKWKIMKMTVSGGITTIRKANGNDNFEHIWDNRAVINYM